jgi:hypothetical protein
MFTEYQLEAVAQNSPSTSLLIIIQRETFSESLSIVGVHVSCNMTLFGPRANRT